MTDQRSTNFAVLTLAVQALERKSSSDGTPYLEGQAALPMGAGRPAMPVRLVVTNGLMSVLQAGKEYTLFGQLGYEEQDGQPVYLFFPSRFEPVGRARNFARLTVRAGQDAEARYSASGTFWSRVRAALGQGRDTDGSWRPSLWINAKAFGRNGDDSLPNALNAVSKGDLFEVSGRLVYEVFEGRPHIDLIAASLAAPAETPERDELAGEPDADGARQR